jgi:hypothetical protein
MNHQYVQLVHIGICVILVTSALLVLGLVFPS